MCRFLCLKCSKTHLQASSPKFSLGLYPQILIKKGEKQKGEEGKEKEGRGCVVTLGGMDAPVLNHCNNTSAKLLIFGLRLRAGRTLIRLRSSAWAADSINFRIP